MRNFGIMDATESGKEYTEYTHEEVFYVVGSGRDCDGMAKHSTTRFSSREKAEEFAKEQSEFSDGIMYEVVEV